MTSAFLADENIPHPSYEILSAAGLDIRHVGVDSPSISDTMVLQVAREQNRILLTLDRDHGELVFHRLVAPPPGVIYFRIADFRPPELGRLLLDLISKGVALEGFFTVVDQHGFRQRPL